MMEDRIRSVFEDIPVQFQNEGAKDRVWTKTLLERLAEVGRSLECNVCYSGGDDDEAGWMHDLVWFRNDSTGQLEWLPLVLECEWQKPYDKIKYDFEKLLIAKATFKVMIFQATGERMQKYFEMLKSAIRAFEGATNATGERYLLACFDEAEDKWGFKIEAFGGEDRTSGTRVERPLGI